MSNKSYNIDSTFSTGDAPSCQIESGHKKGGHYFCWFCECHAPSCNNLQHSLYGELVSLVDKCDKLMSTTVGTRLQREGSQHYVSSLDKADVELDLHERGIRHPNNLKCSDLRQLLENEMKGTQRLPALLFDREEFNMKEIGMESYEVLPVEPLHTIKEHIKNLFQEIPRHLIKTERIVFERGLTVIFAENQLKRGCDYRKALVQLTLFVNDRIDSKFSALLTGLCEIQEIFYSNQRSPALVLRLYNLTFMHASIMIELLKNPQVLTKRKLFGQYFHALVCHSPQQFRILGLPSSNAEDEERMFKFLKSASTWTSNHHPDNVLSNAFIRLQVRDEYDDQKKTCKKRKTSQSAISRTGKKLPAKSETFVPFKTIIRSPAAWQAHLERIADFLQVKGIWREGKRGIHFADLKCFDMPLSHFRSSSIKKEHEQVKAIWVKILRETPRLIPAHRIMNDDGSTQLIDSLNKCKSNIGMF